MKAAAPITGGISCPPLEAAVSTAPENSESNPLFFINGIVNDPVPTTFATALPEIVPNKLLATTATFAGPPLNPPSNACVNLINISPAPEASKTPANITKIAFTVTIYDAEVRRQNFGQVNNAFIRIYNEETGEELLRYDLGEDFSIETAAVFGELYKSGDEWKFNAIGSGYQGGLAALCANYGIDVE